MPTHVEASGIALKDVNSGCDPVKAKDPVSPAPRLVKLKSLALLNVVLPDQSTSLNVPVLVEHSVEELLRQRIVALALRAVPAAGIPGSSDLVGSLSLV